jgi:3-deoxy-D-arabino-heptulosonate 7-phosphate (DAHP) synthase class II
LLIAYFVAEEALMSKRKKVASAGWDRFQADVKELSEQLAKVVSDPKLRASTGKAAQSFGEALAETLKKVADEVGGAVRRGR